MMAFPRALPKILLSLGLLLAALPWLAACDLQPSPAPTTTSAPLKPSASRVPTLDETLPGSMEFTLRIVRAGKVYPVVLGYDLGEAFFRATPRPELPDWYLDTRNIHSSSLEWYGDLDGDGETEYLVTYASRAAGCYTGVLAVDYDAKKDAYAVFADLAGPCAVIGALEDLDGDAIPELRSKNTAVYFTLGGTGDGSLLSPIAILRYDGATFAAASGEFPALVEEDIARWFQMLDDPQSPPAPDLLLAAILVDRLALGQRDAGIEEFNKLCAQHLPTQSDCQDLLQRILKAVSP